MAFNKQEFTVFNDSRINEKINCDLKYIKKTLLQEFSGIHSMVLVGGFGRGEGSVLLEGNNIIPVNDYDIVLIAYKKIDKNKINKIRKQLAKDLGIWWVDISVYLISQMRVLPYTMYVYDFKYGGYVFFGDKSILKYIPDMNSERMPLVESELLCFTRLWCFLGAFKEDFLQRVLSDKEKFFLMYQLSKAICAVIDTKLILNKAYHYSYVKKIDIFQEIYSNEEELIELSNFAIDFKLKPYKKMDTDLIEMYFRVKDIFIKEMFQFVCKMYKKNFSDWDDYVKTYLITFKVLVKRFVSLFMGRTKSLCNRNYVNLAQLYLVASLKKDSVDCHLLKKAVNMLSKIEGKDLSSLSWEKARTLVVDLRMKV